MKPIRDASPQTVEELIAFLNTNGGTCYLEHADAIRKFVKEEGDRRADWMRQATINRIKQGINP